MLSALAAASLGAGVVAAEATGHRHSALAPGLIALFVAVAALASPRASLWKAGLICGLIGFVMLILAYATAGAPVAAAAAMAIVTFTGGILRAGGAGLAAAGTILSGAYFLPAATGAIQGLTLEDAVELGAIGVTAGLIVTALVVLFRALRGHPPSEPVDPVSTAGRGPSGRRAIGAALRGRDVTFRYAVRRAVALGVVMGVYQAHTGRTVFWVMLTMFIVMQPDPAATWQRAISRSSGVIVGAVAISALAEVVPAGAVVALAVPLLLLGIAFFRSNYTVYSAGLSFATIAFIAAQHHTVTTWAARRIIDTLIGVSIALLAGYLLLPDRDGSHGQPAAARRHSNDRADNATVIRP